MASLLLVGWTSGNSNGGPILNCRCELSNDKSNRRLGRYSDPESNGENPTSPRGAQRPERLSLPLTPNIKHRHLDRRNRQSHRLLRSGETRISPLPLPVLAVVFVSGYPKASADAGNVESCLRTRLQPLRYVFFCYAHFFNTLFSLGSLSRSTAQRPPLCRRRGSPTSGSLLVGVNAGVQPEGRNNPSITLVLALAVACSRCKLQKPQQKACQAPNLLTS